MFWLAAEGRLKPPLTSVWLVKRAFNLFLSLVLNVCITGSRGWPLPVTLSRVLSEEDSGMAEALRGRVSVPARAELVIQYIQGVLAVHSSDHDKAHHLMCMTAHHRNPEFGFQTSDPTFCSAQVISSTVPRLRTDLKVHPSFKPLSRLCPTGTPGSRCGCHDLANQTHRPAIFWDQTAC